MGARACMHSTWASSPWASEHAPCQAPPAAPTHRKVFLACAQQLPLGLQIFSLHLGVPHLVQRNAGSRFGRLVASVKAAANAAAAHSLCSLPPPPPIPHTHTCNQALPVSAAGTAVPTLTITTCSISIWFSSRIFISWGQAGRGQGRGHVAQYTLGQQGRQAGQGATLRDTHSGSSARHGQGADEAQGGQRHAVDTWHGRRMQHLMHTSGRLAQPKRGGR